MSELPMKCPRCGGQPPATLADWAWVVAIFLAVYAAGHVALWVRGG